MTASGNLSTRMMLHAGYAVCPLSGRRPRVLSWFRVDVFILFSPFDPLWICHTALLSLSRAQNGLQEKDPPSPSVFSHSCQFKPALFFKVFVDFDTKQFSSFFYEPCPTGECPYRQHIFQKRNNPFGLSFGRYEKIFPLGERFKLSNVSASAASIVTGNVFDAGPIQKVEATVPILPKRMRW